MTWARLLTSCSLRFGRADSQPREHSTAVPRPSLEAVLAGGGGGELEVESLADADRLAGRPLDLPPTRKVGAVLRHWPPGDERRVAEEVHAHRRAAGGDVDESQTEGHADTDVERC